MRRIKENKGQSLVEYILIVSVIAIIGVSAIKNFGGYLTDSITEINCSLANEEYIEGENPGEAYCRNPKYDKKEDND